MNYVVVIEEGESGYGAFVPDLPGCVAAGETREEVVALISEAIELHLEDLQATEGIIPKPHCSSELVEVKAG